MGHKEPKINPNSITASFSDSKVSSSKIPNFALIPYISLVQVAERFELGQEKHGEKAWNALSPNQEALLDKAWINYRAAHVIDHAMKLIGKLNGQIEDDGDNDAAAIAWGGMFLCAAMNAMRKNKEKMKGKNKGGDSK